MLLHLLFCFKQKPPKRCLSGGQGIEAGIHQVAIDLIMVTLLRRAFLGGGLNWKKVF